MKTEGGKEHTETPWHVVEDRGDYYVETDHCTIADCTSWDAQTGRKPCPAEAPANAAYIVLNCYEHWNVISKNPPTSPPRNHATSFPTALRIERTGAAPLPSSARPRIAGREIRPALTAAKRRAEIMAAVHAAATEVSLQRERLAELDITRAAGKVFDIIIRELKHAAVL